MSDVMEGFLEAAKTGIVTVEFTKVGTGELRIMPCTLNRELSNDNVPEVLEQQKSSEHYAVWSIDKQAWRSFRTDTVIRWYTNNPEIQNA